MPKKDGTCSNGNGNGKGNCSNQQSCGCNKGIGCKGNGKKGKN